MTKKKRQKSPQRFVKVVRLQVLSLLQHCCRSVAESISHFSLSVEQLVTAMSSYMNARKSSDKRPDATCCLQPAMISGHVMHKYAWIMPPPEPFVLRNDCNAEKNFSDICAAIRHHILDQVASSAPVVSTNQSAVRDVCLLKRPHSATSYSVRGTK